MYNPSAYSEIINIGRQTIQHDLNNELKHTKHVFSNTDSVGFGTDQQSLDTQAITDLVNELNQKRVFLKYNIEH